MNDKRSFWSTIPGLLTGIAAIITAAGGLLIALSQTGYLGDKKPNDAAPISPAQNPAERSTISKTDKVVPAANLQQFEPSEDIDNPAPLSSNVIEGLGIGEPVSYYYSFYGGPGYIEVTARALNQAGFAANALGLTISKVEGKELTKINMGYQGRRHTENRRFPLGRRERLILRVDLDPRTIEYKVELSGAIDFGGG